MKSTEKGTIIVEGTFQAGYEPYFEEYSLKIKALLTKLWAVVIRRQLIEDTLYGNDKPSLIMVIDFPDKEIARSAFFESEYTAIIPLRSKIFKSFKMYLARYGEV